MSAAADRAKPRVTVCGLGPSAPELVTVATTAAVDRIAHRYLRTRRHPSAPVVGAATAFDVAYEAAETFDEVYDTIVTRLVDAAEEHGEVLYAVPGSPMVAETTVERLLADERVEVEVLPALSFLDLAWIRLGIDPADRNVRLVDGHRFGVDAAGERGPLLVTQCDRRDVLSDIKLALGDLVSADADVDHPEPTVIVLQRLGLPDEQVTEVVWSELDRTVEPDHLTSVYLPVLAAPVAGELAELEQVMRRLRRECPWDREQTHGSLRRHLLEEAYEVVEAIDHLDPAAGEGFEDLEEELGDLLIQVYFHSILAAEEGYFGLADVARAVRLKLVGRHPHVFGDVVAETVDDVRSHWDRLKQVEKGRETVMDGIPSVLPALLYALKVQRRAASAGVDWRDLVADGRDEKRNGGGEELGWRLMELVGEAGGAGLDPETELRLVAEQVRDSFVARERQARPHLAQQDE